MDTTSDPLIRRIPSRDEVLFLLIGSGFVFLGQTLRIGLPIYSLNRSYAVILIGIAFLALAFYSFLRGGPPRFYVIIGDRISSWLNMDRHRLLLLLIAPVISYSAWLAAGDELWMHIPWLAVSAWLFSIVLVILVSAGELKRPTLRSPDPKEWLIPLALFFTALLLRATLLDRIPWLLSGDEGSAGNSAVEFLQGQWNNLFATAWYSFPSLYFIFPTASIGLLGQTTQALRLPSALAGALTVVATYWYGRKAFGQTIALAASIFLAAFHFHIHFSRIGLNNIWDGLLFTVFSVLLWTAWKQNTKLNFALAGLTLAASIYVYASARMIVVVLFIWLLVALIQNPARFKERIHGLVVLSIVALTAALPLGLYYLRHPNEFMAPLVRVSILGPWLENEVVQRIQPASVILFEQFKTSALAFTSENLRHWYAIDSPMLLALPATLFLVGLFLLIIRISRLQNLWLALWILAAVAVGALSESTPAAQRYVFVAPAVALIIGLSIGQLEYWLSAKWPSRKNLFFAGLMSVVAIAAIIDLHFYFADYTPSKRFSDRNTEVAQSAADWLSQFDEQVTVYFFGFPRMGYHSIQSLPYLAPHAVGYNIEVELNPEEWQAVPPTVFLFLPERIQDMEIVRDEFPGGDKEVHRSYTGDQLYITYTLH